MGSSLRRKAGAACIGLVLGAGILSASSADPLGVVAEGVLGIPLAPGRTFWDYRTPTTLLERKSFVVAVSGQVSDLLNRKYLSGRADKGYSIGVSGGAVARWEYGVSGIWALGSGQSQSWSHPTGLYTLTPSPKIGVMAVSHAWKRGPWALGGTIYRTSFSLTDTFVFERFPRSSDQVVNRYLYDLLPAAIGKSIAYDALGDRLLFYGDLLRTTAIGQFGLVLNGWWAGADWLTQHTNTISDTRYDRFILAGTKTGDGHGGWHGTGLEGRWRTPLSRKMDVELRAGRGRWSGDAHMWLRNPVETEQGAYSVAELEPRDWGQDSVSATSWNVKIGTGWHHSEATTFAAEATWQRHTFATTAFGRTPVLNLDLTPRGFAVIQQAASVGLDGSLDALAIDLFLSRHPQQANWGWEIGMGVAQFDGTAKTRFAPQTIGFRSSPSHHTWEWSAVRLAYAELAYNRQITQQIFLTYSYRQYLPLSGTWKRDGTSATIPGGVSGIKFGSMHQLRVAMRL